MESNPERHIGDILRERNIEIIGADPATRYGFTQVPNFILTKKEISVGAKLAYAMLLKYAWDNDLCRRGQVQWALWHLSAIGRPAADEPSSVFRNRLKRLLEIDRERLKERGKNGQGLAFSEDRPEGTGTDVAFSAYDGFILALGLDLLRMGFVQSEVTSLMHFLRPRLGDTFDEILRNPPGSQRRSLRTRPLPIRREDDRRVFLVIERVEMSEEFPAFAQAKRGPEGAFYREPKICHGLQGVTDQLDRMDQVFRRALVLDLAHTAVRVSEFLAKAPEIRRGRPSSTVLASV